MITNLWPSSLQPMFEDKEHWLCYTDIYQHYLFRYPSCCIASRWGQTVQLSFDLKAQRIFTTSPWEGCRFYFQKVMPFHDRIDLEEYLLFEQRQRNLPFSSDHSVLTGLQPGYRSVRAICHQNDGMRLSIILVSYQARMIPIYTVLRDGMDLDINLAQSVRFF